MGKERIKIQTEELTSKKQVAEEILGEIDKAKSITDIKEILKKIVSQ